jgi:hypothetical protein
MKYITITLLFIVISLTNSAVVLQLEGGRRAFDDFKIFVSKKNPEKLRIKYEGKKPRLLNEFKSDDLIKELQEQHCVAAPDGDNKIYRIDLVESQNSCQKDLGFSKVNNFILKIGETTSLGFCCIQFDYYLEDRNAVINIPGIKRKICYKLALADTNNFTFIRHAKIGDSSGFWIYLKMAAPEKPCPPGYKRYNPKFTDHTAQFLKVKNVDWCAKMNVVFIYNEEDKKCKFYIII